MTSTSDAGNFAFSFAAAGISPVWTRSTILPCSVVADPRELGGLAGEGQLLDRYGAALDHSGGLAIGDDPVADGAVELVKGRELGHRGGDLGVAHGASDSRLRGVSANSARVARPAHVQRGREPRADRRGRSRAAALRRAACWWSTTPRPTAPARSPTGCGERYDDVEVLHRARKEGLGPAYVAGFERALDGGAALVAQMDADFSHDPADLPRLLAAAEGADLVLGSRYVDGGGVADWGAVRRLISRGGSAYARTVLGLGVRDLTGGFKVFRREVLEAIDLETISSLGYAFQVETTYRGAARRLSGGRGADRLRRPPRRRVEDERCDRARGSPAGARDAPGAAATVDRRDYTF